MSPWLRPFLITYAVLVGAVVGSFLNVVIYRIPRRRSIVKPGSACPGCEAPIRWYDNIPILSWIVLRGRCRHCRASIALRYPLVEATAAFIAALAVHQYGLTVAALEVVLFAWISLALGVIDLEHQLLPDVLTYPSIALGIGAAWLGGVTTLLQSVIGAAVGAAIPTMVIFAYRWLRGEEGMGWGDVKYLAAIGAVVGVRDCLWVLVIAAVAGAVVGLILWVAGKGSGKTALPFGTFLAAAVIIWLYLPESLRLAIRALGMYTAP
jgi:leader peptidase (prepilin peptidase)/N-methyltransferase